MTSTSQAASLSHPEPVAQEAVDRLWDRPIMELAMVKAGHFFDVTAKQGKIGETREAYIASNWSHWREDAIAEVAALSGLAHPSPSPEQGEDTGPVTSRLNQISRRSNIWREVAETGDQGNEPLPQALDALDEAVRIARACRRELSTLRSRVAELEARATPQAGASEAGPVAWMRDYPDMTCLTTTKPEPPEPGWRDIWMPLYATPPDSDTVRAAFGDGKWVIDTGTMGGKPAVFIAPASMLGEVGSSARREGQPVNSLVAGEWYMTFPTYAQATLVADALCNAAAASQDGVREALRIIRDTFMKDESQGYRSRDRQFAIEIATAALSNQGSSSNGQ